MYFRSEQSSIQDSQTRLETSHAQLRDVLTESHSNIGTSQTQIKSATERLEESQAQIIMQLQEIIAAQQQQPIPALSHSLDASSPEGRQTWMNLGRVLRAEGITPAMIEENHDLLVSAMKTQLSLDVVADESYRTAPEYPGDRPVDLGAGSSMSLFASFNSNPYRETCSIPILGSAPPSVAAFPAEFLRRQGASAGTLDHKENVEHGMESLLQGMGMDESQIGEDEEPASPEPGHRFAYQDIDFEVP